MIKYVCIFLYINISLGAVLWAVEYTQDFTGHRKHFTTLKIKQRDFFFSPRHCACDRGKRSVVCLLYYIRQASITSNLTKHPWLLFPIKTEVTRKMCAPWLLRKLLGLFMCDRVNALFILLFILCNNKWRKKNRLKQA